jgi:hypothetical protein
MLPSVLTAIAMPKLSISLKAWLGLCDYPSNWADAYDTAATLLVLQLRDGLNLEHKARLDMMLIKQAEFAKSTAIGLTLQSNAPIALPAQSLRHYGSNTESSTTGLLLGV